MPIHLLFRTRKEEWTPRPEVWSVRPRYMALCGTTGPRYRHTFVHIDAFLWLYHTRGVGKRICRECWSDWELFGETPEEWERNRAKDAIEIEAMVRKAMGEEETWEETWIWP